MRPYRRHFAGITLLAALGTGAGLIEPIIYRAAINDVAGVFVHQAHQEGRVVGSPAVDTHQRHRKGRVAPRTADQALQTLLISVALLFLTSVAASVFDVLAENASYRVGCRIEGDLISDTFKRVLHLPLGFFSKRSSAVLAKQIDQTDQVAPIVNAFAKDVAPEVIRLLGVLAIMLTQSVALTLLAVVTIPAYLLLSLAASRRLESNLSRYYELWEEVGSRIQQALGAVKTVKLSGAEAREVARLRDASHEAYDAELDRTRLANRFYLAQVLLAQTGRAMVFGYGGWKVFGHQLTPGDVVMFVAYLDQLYDPVDSLASMRITVQQQIASLRRAFRLLKTGEAEPQGDALSPGPGRIEVRDLRFGYVADREVLRGVSFLVEPGKHTALVGPSGAGKTTLVDLLLRLYEPTAGAIFLDDKPLRQIDPAALRRDISVVSADGAILRGTIAENIRYKRPDASPEDVQAAVVGAGLTRTIDRLGDGLDTQVGEGGVGLSVGERQRVLIARVLLARPRVLILDEATANLDYATELEVKVAFDELRRRCTTLTIAHRYSMVRDADHVIVLDAGEVVEQGTPQELLASGEWFAHLAHSGQAQSEESDQTRSA